MEMNYSVRQTTAVNHVKQVPMVSLATEVMINWAVVLTVLNTKLTDKQTAHHTLS